MRLLCLLAILAAAGCADEPPGPTLDGVDPVQGDGALAPDPTLQPGDQGLAPEPDLTPEPDLEPEATLQPDTTAVP